MFDVAFSELVVIAVVALIVIGPEKLPKVARTLGALVGRMQRYVAQLKEEVNREVRFQELQQLQQEIQEAANNTQANVKQQIGDVAQNLQQKLDADVLDKQMLDAEIASTQISSNPSTADLFSSATQHNNETDTAQLASKPTTTKTSK